MYKQVTERYAYEVFPFLINGVQPYTADYPTELAWSSRVIITDPNPDFSSFVDLPTHPEKPVQEGTNLGTMTYEEAEFWAVTFLEFAMSVGMSVPVDTQ